MPPRILFAERKPDSWKLVLALAVGIGTFVGWWVFWFLTDDAFIAFRYASNHMRGFGLVWNPPPFAAVEGYTCFLWVVLLEAVWRLTGVTPPEAANWLSLGFGYGTLYLGYRFVERMSLPHPVARYRVALAALVLLGTISNRTFLAWLSSGLETSLFNFLLVGWIYCGLTPPQQRGRFWLLRFALASALTALTRPDGLLFVMAFASIAAFETVAGRSPRSRLLQTAPLLFVPAHLLWRHWTYGEWLPNTYYAKYSGPWPEAGLRYLLSFVLEYGVWVWAGIALAAARARFVRRSGRGFDFAALLRAPTLTLAATAAHVAYYTFIVGGDHFEFRVYSHLIVLLFVSALWLASRAAPRPLPAAALLSLLIVASWPIPWAHWLATRELDTRAETIQMIRPIAGDLPFWLTPLTRPWDRAQSWLIHHSICMRHQEHKVFYEEQLRHYPDRERGSQIRWSARAVLPLASVGVPSWVFPEVAIIDLLGLNDRFIAHRPRPTRRRRMAHDRRGPLSYVMCFRPNVSVARGRFEVTPRLPLTDEEIAICDRGE